MKKEDLIELKKKISNLSDEEKELRDKYLQQMSNGEILGPTVGYSSIDKTWLKYIDLDKHYQNREKKTIYQEIRDNNRLNLNNTAIEFFLSKIKYKKLFKKIDEYAKSFVANGIKEGDFVTICCAGIPEMIYSFYALAKIGAVANFMSPFFDKNQMRDRIKDCNSHLLLVMDSFYEIIKPAIEESTIKKTVILPTLNSSVLKYLKPSKKIKEESVISLNKFIEEGYNIKSVSEVAYKPDMPLALVYSSGSTGASKAIMLSNDSFQNSIHSYEACGIDLDGSQKFYQIIPPWFSTGSSTSIHLPLSNGAVVFMDPRFDRKIFVKNVVKNKINATVAPTSMYEGFLDRDLIKNGDLSHFTNPFQGGEALKKETKEGIEDVFKEHGSSSALKIGYGQCECGAGIATQTDDFYRSDGSVGIPIPGVICAIFDDEKNELTYGNRGEILVSTKSGMVEYFNNPEASNDYFYIDEAGVKWNCTGDIGYMDNEGNLFVQGRKSDFTIVNGEKIFNFDVENVIMSDHDVKNVDILSVNGNGEEFVCHIIFDDEFILKNQNNESVLYDKILEIQEKLFDCFENINYVPTSFKIRKEFPFAKSGKRDIFAMKNETDGFINIPYEKRDILKK